MLVTESDTSQITERKPLKHIVQKLLAFFVYFWVPAIIFIKLADEVREKDPLPGDAAILNVVRETSTPWLDTVMVAVTNLGGAPFVISGLIITLLILVLKQRKRLAVFLLFSIGGTALMNLLFKLLFQRERPTLWQHLVTENSYSFPSGHAMISSAIAFSLIAMTWHSRFRWIGIIFGILYMIIIGFSRLYLGVHFPSDILGGWSVSLLWVVIVHAIFKRFSGQEKAAKNT